jgi:hypothetical protein
VVIMASLIIAACGLAVNIAAGLGERRRPFRLLRLTGVPTGVLRRVVALESALPLFLVATTRQLMTPNLMRVLPGPPLRVVSRHLL